MDFFRTISIALLALSTLLGCGEPPPQPLDATQTANVQAAITLINSQGYTNEASKLQEMLNSGRIKVGGEKGCARSHNYTNVKIMQIDLVSRYATKGPTDALASILLHEFFHSVYIVTGLPLDPPHCAVYWEGYKFLKNLSSITPQGTQSISSIETWYPGFANQPTTGGPPPFAPPPASCDQATDHIDNLNFDTTYTIDGTNHIHVTSGPYNQPPQTTIDITLPGDVVHSILLGRTPQDITYLLVGCRTTSTHQGAIYVVTDSDSDHIVDTISTIYSSGSNSDTPASLVSITSSGITKWYVLDTELDNIRAILDSSGDGIPDSLGGVFANRTTTPHLALARSIITNSILFDPTASGTLQVAFTSLPSGIDFAPPTEWAVVLYDMNNDGVAESASAKKPFNQWLFSAPHHVAAGQAGDSFVIACGMPGSTLKVMGYDSSSGGYTSELGSATVPISSDGYTTISVPPIAAGQSFLVKDIATNLSSSPITATSPTATITGVYPRIGRSGLETVITINGVHLPPSPVVKFDGTSGTILSANSTTIVVKCPPLVTNSLKGARISLEQSGAVVDSDWTFVYFAP